MLNLEIQTFVLGLEAVVAVRRSGHHPLYVVLLEQLQVVLHQELKQSLLPQPAHLAPTAKLLVPQRPKVNPCPLENLDHVLGHCLNAVVVGRSAAHVIK